MIRTGFVLAFLLLAVDISLAREWRGIVPLRSTRADVVRIFNQCADQREACVFSVDREDVFILFSGGLSREYVRCARSVDPETVIFVQVEPRMKLKLDDLNIRKKTLEVLNSSAITAPGVVGYRSKDDLIVSTVRGRIIQVNYLGDVPDVHPCARYYDEPESFIQTFVGHHPIAVIDCPTEARARLSLTLKAESGSGTPKRGPIWSVNAGNILSGQHTYTIILDTSGLAEQTILVTAEISDAFKHTVFASCTITITKD